MKTYLVLTFYFLCYIVRITELFYFLTRRNQRVITYHNVIPDKEYDDSIHLGVSCSLSSFEAQIKEIVKKFRCTTKLDEPNSCVITFDDGYKNNYVCASNLLNKYNIKAYFFLPLENFNTQKIIWVDKLLMWLSYVPTGQYMVVDNTMLLKNRKSREFAWDVLWRKLLDDSNSKEEIRRGMNDAFSFDKLSIPKKMKHLRFNMMNQCDIEQLKKQGHLIGCHSYSHEILSKLENDNLDKDFSQCESQIGSLYNTEIYSYPFGGEEEVSFSVIEKCKRSRFTSAVMNSNTSNSPYTISRISLPNTSNKYVIHAYLSGFKTFLDYLKNVLKN